MQIDASAFFTVEDNAGLILAGLLACRSFFLPCLPIFTTVAGDPEIDIVNADKVFPSP
jgi:hypothetical protein